MKEINYTIKPLDIVLIRTDASKNRFSQTYLTEHPGMTREGTLKEREYYHIENLINLDQIPKPFGFTVSAFPIKLRGATASPIRAVAIVEE